MSFLKATAKRPPIVIDITRLIGRYQQGKLPTGVDRVSLAYVQHFRKQALAKASWRWASGLISPHLSIQLFDALLAWELTPLAQGKFKKVLTQGIWSSVRQVHWRGQWLFNTSHLGIESARYKRDLRWHAHCPVFFLHDLIPITHPQFCRDGEASKHETRIKNMLAWGHGLIVNSHDTEKHLRQYAEQAKLHVPAVLVAPLASALATSPITQQNAQVSGQTYFLVIGTIEPRKNIPLLMQVWRNLVQELGARAPQLVVVGQMGWESARVADQLRDAQIWQGRLQWRESCTDAELSSLLQNACALLFPSFVEGYGMPVIEALQNNVPVIASDLQVLREVAGGIPDYLKPDDPQVWQETVLDFALPQSTKRRAQQERLQGFAPTTWAQHFEQVDAFLHNLERVQ
jgi:glycosyltransferase involved in cell wall biosynthesis